MNCIGASNGGIRPASRLPRLTTLTNLALLTPTRSQLTDATWLCLLGHPRAVARMNREAAQASPAMPQTYFAGRIRAPKRYPSED